MKLILALALTLPLLALAADADKKPKPYPLANCVVSDEKIGADPAMKPYTFTHEGQEVKLCCKSCLKDFKKDPAKYMAKITAADKKTK
jgi:hypothetical protein